MIIEEKIGRANSVKEMNALRDEVVKVMTPSILKQWQDKYWALKQCPTCGKNI